MKKIIFILLLATTFSCSNSDDSPTEELLIPGNKLTAKIDGQNFAALDESTSAGFSQANSVTAILIAGGSTNPSSSNFSTEAIGIALTIIQESEFTASSQWYVNSDNGDIIVAGAYSRGDSLNDTSNIIEASSDTDQLSSARIRITKLDRTLKTISGEFEFTAEDEETGQIYTITEGRFNDIQYDSN